LKKAIEQRRRATSKSLTCLFRRDIIADKERLAEYNRVSWVERGLRVNGGVAEAVRSCWTVLLSVMSWNTVHASYVLTSSELKYSYLYALWISVHWLVLLHWAVAELFALCISIKNVICISLSNINSDRCRLLHTCWHRASSNIHIYALWISVSNVRFYNQHALAICY
jgi:hypothetical protein